MAAKKKAAKTLKKGGCKASLKKGGKISGS